MTATSRVVPAVPAVLIATLLLAGIRTAADRRADAAGTANAATTAVVAELQAFVESVRGLRFLEPVDVSVLGDAAFRRELSHGGPSEELDVELQAGVLRALGLLQGGDDLGRAGEFDPDEVAGFYDTETKELVVRGRRLTPFVRQVIVHELTHALDDQHFDLDRDVADEEAALAYEALIEGDAVVVESRYLASLSPAERREAEAEEKATFGGGDGSDIAQVLVDLAEFPYRDGPDLVAAIVEAGGQARLDRAFRSPPTTSAQVLHPDRFLAGRPLARVPAVAAGGRVVDEGPLGELVLRFVLAGSMPEERAAGAAAGWAGDRYVAWRAGRQTCVRVVVVLDSPAEAGELVNAVRQWAGDHPGATVDPAPASNAVGVSRCA